MQVYLVFEIVKSHCRVMYVWLTKDLVNAHVIYYMCNMPHVFRRHSAIYIYIYIHVYMADYYDILSVLRRQYGRDMSKISM